MRDTMGKAMQILFWPMLKLAMGMVTPWNGTQTSLHCILSDTIEPGAFYSYGPK